MTVRLALTLLALFLAACGSGGTPLGPDPLGSGDGIVTGDVNEQPAIIRIFPAPGAVDVPTDTFVELEFATPLDLSEIDDGTLTIDAGDGPVETTRTLLAGNRILRITPVAPLPQSSRPRVRLVAGLEDVAGNKRPNPFAYEFACIQSVMQPAVPVSSSTTVGVARAVELAPDGTGIAVYFEVDAGGTSTLWAQRLADAQPTEPPFALATGLANAQVDAQGVAVAERGYAVVAWSSGSGGRDAHAAFFDPQLGTWSADVLESGAQVNSSRPKAAISRTGFALLAWFETPSGQTEKSVRIATRNTFLTTPAFDTLSDPNENAEDLVMQMNANGSGVIAWIENPTKRVMAASHSNGAIGAPVRVDSVSPDMGKEKLCAAIGTSGQAILAWRGDHVLTTADPEVLAVVGRPSTGLWNPQVSLQAAPGIGDLKARAFQDEDRILIWTAEESGGDELFGTRFRRGAGFDAVGPLSPDSPIDASLPTIDINGRGDALIGYQRATLAEAAGHATLWPVDGDPIHVDLGVTGRAVTAAIDPSGGGLLGLTTPNDPLDPLQGSVQRIVRLRPNGSVAFEVPLTEVELGVDSTGCFLAIDSNGKGAGLFSSFDIAQFMGEASLALYR